MNHLKHIPLKSAYNARDLGGYPTTDGRYTHWGLLYRSDALSELTDGDWRILMNRNVKTIIDLRSLTETASAKINTPAGMKYYHFSLMKDLDQNLQNVSQDTILESMKLDYVKTLFGNLSCCAKVLNTISERMESGSIIFLCSAGKDRTGIIAALVLYLCDVIREDIIADYIVSSTYNTNGINKKLDFLPDAIMKMIPDITLLKSVFESRPETIIKLLDELDSRSIRSLLDKEGFSYERQSQLKAQFTELSGEMNK